MHNSTADLVILVATLWVLASAATYILTSTSIFYWLRVRVQRPVLRARDRLADEIKALPPDYPRRLLNRKRSLYWLREASTHFPFCPVCVGWWCHQAAALTGWLILGAPATIGPLPAFLVVLAASHASWLAFLLLVEHLPASQHLPDPRDIENDA